MLLFSLTIKAAENRARRGVPLDAREITLDERKQELWRTAFCILFDLAGVIVSINIQFFNHDECNMPIKFWFLQYGIQSMISAAFLMAFIVEISKLYITRNAEIFSFIIELYSFLISLLGLC